MGRLHIFITNSAVWFNFRRMIRCLLTNRTNVGTGTPRSKTCARLISEPIDGLQDLVSVSREDTAILLED